MADDAARFLASKGVGASENLAADPSISDEELAARCYALRGVPWSEAKARRDMRERMRIWRYLEEGCARVPSSIEDMFADHYPASTLLALVENMQAERARVSSTINEIVHTQGDIGPFVTLILELIVQAIEE